MVQQDISLDGDEMKKLTRSKTMWFGHIQKFTGMVASGLAVVSPQTLPNLTPTQYGVIAIVYAVITYWLRSVTRKPLEDK